MNLFKKIFKPSTVDMPIKHDQVQRHPRVSLGQLHRISFTPVEVTGSTKLNVANLSVSGIGILHEGAGSFQPGHAIAGRLQIDSDAFDIAAIVRHASARMIGLQFTHPTSDLKRSIENYLRVEISAMTLKRVEDAYLKPDPRGKVIWCTDGRQNEIFCVVDEQGILAFHAAFLGNYIEGERGQALRGGVVDEGESKMGHKGSALVDLSGGFTNEIRDLAKTFVSHAMTLPNDVRAQLESLIA